MIPYLECHMLLNATAGAYADENFDLEEHNRLFNEHYPPATEADHKILSITCMGKAVETEDKEPTNEPS